MAGLVDLASSLAAEFGPSWRLGLPLGEAEVGAFEETHGISLPEPYRAFVVEIANGAVGPPHYGLVPLGAPAGTNSYHVVRSGFLARPFPLTEFWMWEGTDDLEDPQKIERFRQTHDFGSLPLGTDGDGMDYALVISGEARGQVWMLTGEGAMPVASNFGAWLLADYLSEAQWLIDSRPHIGESK